MGAKTGAPSLSLAMGLFLALVIAISQPAASQARDLTDQLTKKHSLHEISIGRPDAPVTVVEYSSTTCGQCARFHRDVIPALIEKYARNGTARFIFRDFPLNNLAAATTLLVQCASQDRRYELRRAFFAKQDQWTTGVQKNGPRALFEIARGFGITAKQFEACLTDNKALKKINAARQHATRALGVNGTPSVFVNGRLLTKGFVPNRYAEDGILKVGPLPRSGNVERIPILENSLAGVSKAIEAAR